ncbi:MAG: hypothetical protein WCX70_01775, partial [Candidatus Paceibacterota bacterium]
WGDKERALLSLGHVLHLVQDATVPDHTRDDAHAFKKTYENYAERFTVGSFRFADDLTFTGQKPVRLDTLGEYFDSLAVFSNGNFFSDDTILDEYFNKPTIKEEKYFRLRNGISYNFGLGMLTQALTRIDSKRNLFSGQIEKTYQLDDIDNLVVSDYWQHLSEKAVLGSAGVIELFFKEVAVERKSHRLFDLNKSYIKRFIDRLSIGANNALSALGTLWSLSLSSNNHDLDNNSNIEANIASSQKEEISPILDNIPITESTISQAQIDQLMTEVLALQQQLDDFRAKLETENNQNIESSIELAEISQHVHHHISSVESVSLAADENLIPEVVEKIMIESPVILSPLDFSVPFSTTTIIFSGSSTPGNFVFCDFDHDNIILSDQESGEWELVINDLPQGTTTLNFFARDIGDHISEAVAIEIFIDSLPPTISLSVEECAKSRLSDHCSIDPTEKIHISWTISKPGEYSYKLFNTYEFWGDWGEDLEILMADTTNSSIIYETDLSDGPIGWRLVLSARDNNGEEIQSEPFEIWFSVRSLVINEIGWTGTAASSADEWLELYNSLPFELSLDNFWLVGSDNKPLIELSGTISGQDFYLIERIDDEVISDLPANLVANFVENSEMEGLPDDNLQLRLVKKEDEIEMVWDQTILFNPDYYGLDCSIERRWDRDGNLQSSWEVVNTGWRQNGRDRNNELVAGTPLMENSILRVAPM